MNDEVEKKGEEKEGKRAVSLQSTLIKKPKKLGRETCGSYINDK